MSVYLSDRIPAQSNIVYFTPEAPRACALVARHGVAAGVIHLEKRQGDDAPLCEAVRAFFDEIEHGGFEQAYLEPPTELGYSADALLAALCEYDNGCANIRLCLGGTLPEPKNTAVEDFVKGLGLPSREYVELSMEFLCDIAPACEDDLPSAPAPAPRAVPRPPFMAAMRPRPCMRDKALDEALKKKADGFAAHLFALIDAKGLDDVTCYKRANIDRKTFSKIRCGTYLTPSKPTALALALALHLDLKETEELLRSAGLALSPAREFDIIIRHCIINEIFDIHEINEVLYRYDQPLLGG